MSLTRLLPALALWSALIVPPAGAAPVEFTLDKAHTHVGFAVRHIFSRLPGTFREFDGSLMWDAAKPENSTGRFTARAASISTGVDKRDEHLRSQDFFWVEKHPELVLVVKKLTPTATAGKFKADADLTMRGTTKAVVLDVTHLGTTKNPWGQTVLALEARGIVRRSEWELMWNKALEGGKVLVGEDVELVLDVEANEKAPAPAPAAPDKSKKK